MAKILRELCFFKEVPYGNDGSIFDAMREVEHSQQDKIKPYLLNGVVCAVSPGLVEDVISGEVIGPLSMQTDGVWIWGSDLYTYVAKYNVRLPEEFVEEVICWNGGKFNVDLSTLNF